MMRQFALVGVLLLATLSTPMVAGGTPSGPTTERGSIEDGTTATACTFPVTETDATGTAVTVEAEPERVVTLRPSAAQTMWEIGAREKVVGLSKHASYLAGADERTVVSNDEEAVVNEEVVALEPDLVLAPHTVGNETVTKLREAGLTVYHFPEATTLKHVYAKVERIGRLTGECEGAAATVSWMKERIETVQEATRGEERPDVLYAFFGYTAGSGTFIHEILETAGGNNVAADANVTWYAPINKEVVVAADPDWIVLNSNDPAVPDEEAYDVTAAVRRNQTVVIPIEHLNQPAPRVVYAIETLAARFHPEAYAAANTTSTATPSPTDAPPATTETRATTDATTATTPSSPGVPGFGPSVALLALVVAFVVRRIG